MSCVPWFDGVAVNLAWLLGFAAAAAAAAFWFCLAVPRTCWVRGFDQIDIRRLVGRAAALDCPLKKVTAVRKARVAGSGRAGLSVASAVVGCPWRLHMCPDDAVWEDCDARYDSASFVMPFYTTTAPFPKTGSGQT